MGTGSGLYNDPIRLSILPDLGALSEQSCVSSSQSQTQVSGASSQENVKKIYSGSLKKKPSVRSCTGCSQVKQNCIIIYLYYLLMLKQHFCISYV